jgi:hypothetical protein
VGELLLRHGFFFIVASAQSASNGRPVLLG